MKVISFIGEWRNTKMYTDRDNNEKISIGDLTADEAELIQTAVIRLAEDTNNPEHARILRRVAMNIDKQFE